MRATAALYLFLNVKTSVERNVLTLDFSSLEETPGLFFSTAMWGSLRFLPSFIGHRVAPSVDRKFSQGFFSFILKCSVNV